MEVHGSRLFAQAALLFADAASWVTLAVPRAAMVPSLSPDLEALLRLGMAVLCGLAVGINRAHHGSRPHPNRLRVHVLVGLSACLLVLAAGPDPQARSRVIQGVATGVGFLGAGEILVPPVRSKHGIPEVRGLSSAASIWFTAALGITVAVSRPVPVLMALGLALITLSVRDDGRPPISSEDSGEQTSPQREGLRKESGDGRS